MRANTIMPRRSTATSRFLIVSAKERGERTLVTPLSSSLMLPAAPLPAPSPAFQRREPDGDLRHGVPDGGGDRPSHQRCGLCYERIVLRRVEQRLSKILG